jgi:transcriptional regulator with XRE-family HTH domain
MDTRNTGLGLRLKIERIRRHLRQRDIAFRADLSVSTVSDIENGWKSPTGKQLSAICKAIGILPTELASEELS